jgi:hypothetical protein
MNDFSWVLRLSHEGRAGVILERPSQRIRFDPCTPALSDDVIVLTGADPFSSERIVGVPSVVRGHGSAEVNTEIAGLRFEGVPYVEPPSDGPLLRMSAAAREPTDAARRWMARRSPDPTMVWQITFPNGDRLVHLGHAFHNATDVGWAANIVTRFGAPRWLIVGAPFGHGDALLGRVPAMDAAHVMVTDLQSDIRRAAGRKTEFLTPLVDRLETAGVPVMSFVSQSSVRFE